MPRIVTAFLVAPLLISPIFGPLAVAVYPVLLTITAVLAAPMFLLLLRARLLDWWHAVAAGVACGITCVLVDTLWDFGGRIDNVIGRNNLVIVGLGALTGFLFWWIGIFRNPKFPFLSNDPPKSSLLLVPIFVLGFVAYQHLGYEFYGGRVLKITDTNPYPIPSDKCTAEVRLESGEIVEQGTHEELTYIRGAYYQLVRNQLELGA